MAKGIILLFIKMSLKFMRVKAGEQYFKQYSVRKNTF